MGDVYVDMKLFHLPDGGLITYVHDSFAVDRLDIDEYHQKSADLENMI